MNPLDYYRNKVLLEAIAAQEKRIKNPHDKEDCRQEIFAELYDKMPFTEDEALSLINRIGVKFRRDTNKIAEHELGYDEI